MPTFVKVLVVMLKSILRDRLLHALFAVCLLLFFLVPAFSMFSMRQVQELSITLTLSAISFFLLVFATILGAFSIWRDVERRYTTAVLGLPISRSSFVLGKFLGIAIFILLSAVVMGAISLVVIKVSAAQYKSDLPIHWLTIMLAIAADSLKYIMLVAIALLFSSLSTSFFFPFFATIAIFLAGSASQEVYEYISGEYGRTISPVAKSLVKGLYYVLPNFAAFNLKVQAIYALPLSYAGLGYTFVYFLTYTAIILSLAIWTFSRRELP